MRSIDTFSEPHDREHLARLLLQEATRWSRTRWCNIPAADRDDVAQEVAFTALTDLEGGRPFEELLAGIPVRVRFRGIDMHRRQRRHRGRSLDDPIGEEGGVLRDVIAAPGGDPIEAIDARDRLATLVPAFEALDAYLAQAPRRVRVIEPLAREGLPRQRIAAELRERHGIEVSHAVVRKVISRDLIARFPDLRFLWENRTIVEGPTAESRVRPATAQR